MITREQLKSITKKQVLIFLCVAVFVYFFFVCYDWQELSDAAVDDYTGNIAYLTADTMNLFVNDREGNLVFFKTFDSHGRGGYLWYNEGILYVEFPSRDLLVAINEAGEIMSETTLSEPLRRNPWQQGWIKEGRKYVFYYEDITYCYDQSNYFRNHFLNQRRTLSLISKNGDIQELWVSS
ncbi:MAG: hypothetical protein J6S14_00960 [Clostridia bacterium]|nr:hypothetical protein [Clostridia bacterium]